MSEMKLTELERVLKEIKEAWNETKEHFGKDFPFDDNLNIKIKSE